MENRDLELGRGAYARRAWADAHASLSAVDRAAPLDVEDLERLATAASLIGRMDEYEALLERIHRVYLDAGEPLRAARAAGWLGMNLAIRGEIGPAGGWFGRAHRLVESEQDERVEHGYLLLPTAFQHLAAGELDAAFASAGEAAAVAQRFRDADLLALALHFQGLIRVEQARLPEGLALLDEAMVGVTAREVSPIVTGIVYCGVIACCEEAFDPRRAQQWTNALTRWWEEQPQLVAFTGRCLTHRAGIMLLRGAWREAFEAARFARERCEQAMNRAATGQALYQQGELHRLQGATDAAEGAYREASRYGREPQPGLALLRLQQGNVDAAAAAIRRVVDEATRPMQRAGLLPAYADIMLASGDVQAARAGSRELVETAETSESPMLSAIAAQIGGAVALAENDPSAALASLRHAAEFWQELDAPYETARVQVLRGLACRALGDDDSAAFELDAARAVFEQLGAAPDLARVDELIGRSRNADTHGLSARELEVLRLVATGKTNREIAEALVVSQHTVARHVQNICRKLGVSSRTAATAFAFEHQLV